VRSSFFLKEKYAACSRKGQRDHFKREPYPLETRGPQTRAKRSAGRHVRAPANICCERSGSDDDAHAITRETREEYGVFARPAAVRIRETKKPAAVAGAGFEILAMMSLCR